MLSFGCCDNGAQMLTALLLAAAWFALRALPSLLALPGLSQNVKTITKNIDTRLVR
jgi:hypothetical protein